MFLIIIVIIVIFIVIIIVIVAKLSWLFFFFAWELLNYLGLLQLYAQNLMNISAYDRFTRERRKPAIHKFA